MRSCNGRNGPKGAKLSQNKTPFLSSLKFIPKLIPKRSTYAVWAWVTLSTGYEANPELGGPPPPGSWLPPRADEVRPSCLVHWEAPLPGLFHPDGVHSSQDRSYPTSHSPVGNGLSKLMGLQFSKTNKSPHPSMHQRSLCSPFGMSSSMPHCPNALNVSDVWV